MEFLVEEDMLSLFLGWPGRKVVSASVIIAGQEGSCCVEVEDVIGVQADAYVWVAFVDGKKVTGSTLMLVS